VTDIFVVWVDGDDDIRLAYVHRRIPRAIEALMNTPPTTVLAPSTPTIPDGFSHVLSSLDAMQLQLGPRQTSAVCAYMAEILFHHISDLQNGVPARVAHYAERGLTVDDLDQMGLWLASRAQALSSRGLH
jgi:hypothetical protein